MGNILKEGIMKYQSNPIKKLFVGTTNNLPQKDCTVGIRFMTELVNSQILDVEKYVAERFKKDGYEYLRTDSRLSIIPNISNKSLIEFLETNMYKGVPDFVMFNSEEFFFVEVKKEDDGLRSSQIRWICEHPKTKVIVYNVRNIGDTQYDNEKINKIKKQKQSSQKQKKVYKKRTRIVLKGYPRKVDRKFKIYKDSFNKYGSVYFDTFNGSYKNVHTELCKLFYVVLTFECYGHTESYFSKPKKGVDVSEFKLINNYHSVLMETIKRHCICGIDGVVRTKKGEPRVLYKGIKIRKEIP